MLTDAMDGTLFLLERQMARVWRLPVRAFRRPDCAVFHLGQNWTLELDEHDTNKLADSLDSEAAFREQFEALLSNMRLAEVRREYRA